MRPPNPLMSVEQILAGAKFPGGMITPPATFRTSAPVKGPGFFERLGEGVMPTPQSLMDAGLISDDDIKAARSQGLLSLGASLLADGGPKTASEYVGPLQAVGRGLQAMQGGYKDAVNSAAAMQSGAQQYKSGQQKIEANQTAMDRDKMLQQRRHEIMAKYPVPSDPKKMSEWLNTVIPRFIDLGDDETLETLLKHPALKTDMNRYQQTQTGDSATTFDPATGKFWDPSANDGKGAWTTSVERRMSPDELALKREQIANTRANTQANLAIAGDRNLQTQSNAFSTRNKDIIDRASVIKQALTTLRDSQHDPALYTSAVANFIQAADQKAQIRWQLLKYFKENVDPSIGGRWETLKARMLEGKLPGYVSGSMIRHLGKLLAMSQEDYDRRRTGEVKRHPALEGWIPPSEEIFSEGSFGPSASGGPAAPAPRLPGESIKDYLKRTAGGAQ